MSSPGLSKEHVAAIGELVVNMTRIESIIVDLLSIFVETNILNAIVAFLPIKLLVQDGHFESAAVLVYG
jgi:hypothetical protein